MNLDKLKDLPVAELQSLHAEQRSVAEAAKAEYHDQQDRAEMLSLAVRCKQRGYWPGDTVRLEGKYAGKQDPLAIFVGFHKSVDWPIVRLIKKDGTLSENTTDVYPGGRVTKVE